MNAATDDVSPLDALHSVLLESVRVGFGNWRLYFSGAEVTVWGEVSAHSNGKTSRQDDPGFFSELCSFLGNELSDAELIHSGIVFHFGSHRLSVSTEDDGELVSLLFDHQSGADIWTRVHGTTTHSRGHRENFCGLAP